MIRAEDVRKAMKMQCNFWFAVLTLVIQISGIFSLTSFDSSVTFDKGINRLFDFHLKNLNSTYILSVHQSSRQDSGICEPKFGITRNGALYFTRRSTNTNIYCNTFSFSNTHYLTVSATNQPLRAHMSYYVVVSTNKRDVSLKIPHVEIKFFNGDVGRLTALQRHLNAFLPNELIKLTDSTIASSELYDLLREQLKGSETQSHISGTINLNKDTDLSIVLSSENFSEPRLRLRRQIFSNLHSPVFTNTSYTASIREEIDVGTQIIQITATDSDEGSAGAVRYALQADVDQRSLNVFLIDPETGWITTKGRVNREDIASHRFTVKAEDMGSPSNSAQTMLNIIVEDINDHAPSFELPVYNINVSETVSVPTNIARIRADDRDIGRNKNIIYSIVNRQAVLDFNINRNTGDISNVRALNRENVSEYMFVVKAEDQAVNIADRLSSTVTANIRVLDYNDNAPQFTRSDYTFQVREDINVSVAPRGLGLVSANDADAGNNGNISYSITFGNPFPRIFDIVADTGQLRVITQLDRDRAGGDEYNLRVRARDHGRPALSSVVSVKVIVTDVNDNSPSFRYLTYTFDIYENHVPGVPIDTILATDPDEGNNRLLTYSIIPSARGGQLPIAIDANSGVLTNNATLDREVVSRYEFMILAQDGGSPRQSATSNVTVNVLDINDNRPEFTQSVYTALISEDTAVQEEVTTISAQDRDENDVIRYTIVEGDDNDDFTILREQTFGVLRVNKALSYNRKAQYSLKVRATDSSDKFADCTVLVNVTDKNRHTPVFTQQEYTFQISESAISGATIGQVQADDADIELNGQVTYFFINNGHPLPFMINARTGEIIVNNTLDRDNPLTQDFHVDVIARDRGLPPLQTDFPAVVHVIIEDVNDNAPVFGQLEYTAAISEDNTVGSSVVTVSASDADKPGTANSIIRYSLEGSGNTNGSFYIEASGGTIRINRLLDREVIDEYDLVVYATDSSISDSQSSSVTVRVTVLDVNDNAPQFESETIVRRIYENKPIRSAVEPPIRATDADLGDNAKITFQLVGGDVSAFELQDLDDGSFKLYSKVSLDYESLHKNYTLQVQASSEHMITKATVIVKLQDVNDNRPELQNFMIIINNYPLHFPEGYIGRVPAFDPDESDRLNLRYTIKSGNEASFFTLNSSTGYIKLNKALDSDLSTGGEFVVQVSDVLNSVNASCKLVYRLITDDMLANSVTLRLDGINAASFMSTMYSYAEQALAVVLGVVQSQIYIIDIKEDNEIDTRLHNPILNVSFAAVQEIDGRDVYLNQDFIKEQIYRRLDLLKNLSALTILPFDDSLCVLEPCLNFASCSVTLKFAEAAEFITSSAMLFRPITTESIYACRCPDGFAGQNITYICDTEINLCYSSPCVNGGVCRQVEAGFKCLCPTGFKGERCEFDELKGVFNSSFCPDSVCTGKDAYCVDLIQGGFACHQGAVRCLETDERTDTCGLRTASFVPGSYLMFPSLSSRARFHIQLSFATREKNGLLLYNGRYNYLHDFMSLELVNHSAVFTMSFGDESYSVSVGKQFGLNDGQWHTIDVEYKDWSLVISLDECDVGLSLTHPEIYDYPCAMKYDIRACRGSRRSDNLCTLDLTGPLLVGGVPEYLTLDKVHLTSTYFVGCMRDLQINFQPVDLKSAITDHNTQNGCSYKRNFCVNSPCRNQGTCISSWSTYQCICPEGRSGRDCSLSTGPSYTFYGLGYLKHTSGLESVRKPWYNSFIFKTTVDNRPLLKIDLEQGKTIEYKLSSGYITFHYADFNHSFDGALVNDDKWHHFEMRLITNSDGQGQIGLQLDYGDVQSTAPLDNSLDGLDVLAVWVGGDESTNSDNRGYSGCMKDVKIGSSLSSEALSPSSRANVINGCNKPTRCHVTCSSETSVCQVGWEQSTCLCNEGLVGSDCDSVCSPSYSPCMNGGLCRIDRERALGYKCTCSRRFQGTYCEQKIETQCPASWWGSPVCGPCNCSVELNYDSQCSRNTGACVCKSGYYRAPGKVGCVPCHCYYNPVYGGAVGISCDQRTGQCQCKEGISGKQCDTCENSFAEITSQGCTVRYDSCPKSYRAGIWWTRTKFGVVRIESCPKGSSGNATRECRDNEQGWQLPNLHGCISDQFQVLNRSLVQLEIRRDDDEPVHAADTDSYTYKATNIIQGLRNATEQVDNLYSNDLLISIKILREILLREKIVKSFDLTNTKDRYFLENMIHITSSILRTSLTDHWGYVLHTYKLTALTDLLQDYDDYIANLADNMATKFVTAGMGPFQIIADNMVIGMDTMNSNGGVIPKYNNVKKDDSIFDDITSVRLPANLFNEKPNFMLDGKAVAGYILYNTAAELIVSTATDENNPYTSDIEFNDQTYSGTTSYGGLIVNSAVFSLVLQQGATPAVLEEPLKITFLLQVSDQTRNAQCVYLNSHGKWTNDRCQVEKVLIDRIICSCDHLSTYALVTDFNLNTAGLATHVGVHMYIAVALSLFCFLFTLLIFICLKDLKSNYIYNQINIQLCFCLALIVFVAGSDRYNNEAVCTVVAVLLQFFVLSLFAWIFVNALHLYRILTEKRYIDGEAMFLYIVIGYVGPGVVTGLSVGLSPDEFGTDLLCWLDIDKAMIWSLAGPVLFCCIGIAILLLLGIVNSCQQKTPTTTAKKNDAKNFKSALWISLALMPLSLCTWLFALLTANSPAFDLKSYDYMFSTFSCATAIFTLLAHVIFNPRGRSELRRQLKRCQGHGQLEESETSDKPNNIPFGDYTGDSSLGGHFTFGGSESSTTSNSRLTSGNSNELLAYLRQAQSSTSSDVQTHSQYRRKRRTISDGSSDSETDSEIKTEREKDIELASSHSSDEDEGLAPISLTSISMNAGSPSKDLQGNDSGRLSPLVADNPMTYNAPSPHLEMGFAPPPPYFITPSAQWSSRLSDSTASTHGTQSRLEAPSLQSSDKLQSVDRPSTLKHLAGSPRTMSPNSHDMQSRVSPTYYHQHTNKSFINSPSMQEMMVGQPSPAIPDNADVRQSVGSNSNSLRRLRQNSSDRRQPSPLNHHRVSPANQLRASPANHHRDSPLASHINHVGDEALPDSDSVRTQSSITSHHDDVFMPPPPELSLHLTTQPSSGSGSSSLQRGANSVALSDPLALVETNIDLLSDEDDDLNETEV